MNIYLRYQLEGWAIMFGLIAFIVILNVIGVPLHSLMRQSNWFEQNVEWVFHHPGIK